MRIIKINLIKESENFYFLNANRNVQNNKVLKESIIKKGVLDPIKVMKASDVDASYPLTDGVNAVSKAGKGYVILDGQHRYTTLRDLVAHERAKIEKNEEYVSSLNMVLPCILLEKEDVGDINEYITELNSCSKTWKSSDYIENANKTITNDLLISTINMFKVKGFPISVISRFVCFDNKKLCNKTLNEYVNRKTPIADADAIRAVKLYEFLKFIGFEDTFLKKRYLIEYVIRQSKVSDLNTVLMKLSKLTKAAELNALRDKDCDISVSIERTVNECFEDYVKDEELTQQQVDEQKNRDYLKEITENDVYEAVGLKCLIQDNSDMVSDKENPTYKLAS